MTPEDWPWAHATLDPALDNGIKCGLDAGGDTIIWSYPTPDIAGYTVATKAAAAGVGSGTVQTFGALTEQAGAGYFDGTAIFTAPIGGMYGFTVSANSTTVATYDVYLRMRASFGPWATPYIKTVSPCASLGWSGTLSGVLPCALGGTLTFDLIHNRGSSLDFQDIYMAFYWHSPLPS